MPIKTQSGADLRARLPKPQGNAKPPDLCGRAETSPSKSPLEREFATRWARIYPDLVLASEVEFHPTRKWRFDFCHIETKVAVEVEGGIWTNGAHSRGKHFESDAEKYNAALEMGFAVFRLSEGMIKDLAQLELIASTILQRLEVPRE